MTKLQHERGQQNLKTGQHRVPDLIDEPVCKRVLEGKVGRVVCPLPEKAWKVLYGYFDQFSTFIESNPKCSQIFNETAKRWQSESGLRSYYSGYFSPYYRNTTCQNGKDNKETIQLCEPYIQYLWENQPQVLEIPFYKQLVDGMTSVLFTAYRTYLPEVYAIRGIDKSLADALLPTDALPPLAIRIIRYRSDGYFFTNPHVDKSALTVILHTDEPSNAPCLIFPPCSSVGPPALSEFAPVNSARGESLMFLGAAPREGQYGNYSPVSHAVRPTGKSLVRHVAVFFWLLPHVDLSSFNTSTPFIDDTGLARNTIKNK